MIFATPIIELSISIKFYISREYIQKNFEDIENFMNFLVKNIFRVIFVLLKYKNRRET